MTHFRSDSFSKWLIFIIFWPFAKFQVRNLNKFAQKLLFLNWRDSRKNWSRLESWISLGLILEFKLDLIQKNSQKFGVTFKFINAPEWNKLIIALTSFFKEIFNFHTIESEGFCQPSMVPVTKSEVESDVSRRYSEK